MKIVILLFFLVLFTAQPNAQSDKENIPSKIAGQQNGKIVFTSFRDGNEEIYIMDSDGSNQIRITYNEATDSMPSISADGKIVFVSDRDSSLPEIYIMNGDGTNQTRLTHNSVTDYHPSISLDGKKIAFTREPTNGYAYEVYLMNSDGTNQTRLTDNVEHDYAPSISPDSTKIAFTNHRNNTVQIYIMNIDGSSQTRLTSSGVNFDPSFSHDGTKITFNSLRDGNQEIYVMNSNGSNQARLTNNPAIDISPSFSPDSTKIAFVSNRNARSEIFVMSSDGSNQNSLTNNTTNDGYPSWQFVNQAGVCTYSLFPTSAPVNASANPDSRGGFDVTTQAGCAWTATSNANWITIIEGSGTGSGSVIYSVAANSGAARSGTISVNGQIFTLNQSSASECTYLTSPQQAIITPSGGSGSIYLMTNHSTCAWSTQTDASWITITSGSMGTGNGTVTYSVAANTGQSRTASIMVGGSSFHVYQSSAQPTIITVTTLVETAEGKPVKGAVVTFTIAFTGESLTAVTNAFGYARLKIPSGEGYAITVSHKKYRFPVQNTRIVGEGVMVVFRSQPSMENGGEKEIKINPNLPIEKFSITDYLVK